MKKLSLLLLFGPLLSAAQTSPRFENDTLHTSGGYKIFKGQILHLAKGSAAAGYFRFVKFHFNMGRNDTYNLQNSTIVVNKLRNYKNSGDDQSIRIAGTVTYQDVSKAKADIDIILDFEKAIASHDGLAAELTVPEEFRKAQVETPAVEPKKQAVPAETKKQITVDELKKQLVADEIKKLFDLYKAGALTKEEYEARKKKLLEL